VEITLITVTLLSLFLAISMGVVTWRLVQEERRRSAARLAALAAELGRGGELSVNEAADPLAPGSPADGDAANAPEAETGGLFSSGFQSTSTGWGRFAALAAAAVVGLVVAATVLLLSRPGAGDAAADDGGRPPLDLIALRHAAEGPFLDISGSVRNPAAVDAERLSVVAMAFDAAGTLVATRRTPVDTPSLPPGADSPFTIRLLAAGINRYRISFLLDETTIPHIDRRSAVQPPIPVGDAS
jgi:hypothetical protein